MAYKHGITVREIPTDITAVIEGDAGMQVIVGTAPVNLADDPYNASNRPILAMSKKDAVRAVGYSADFANYTLCQSISACFNVVGTAPVVLINVIDPNKHTADVQETILPVNSGVAELDVQGILMDKLTVKAGDDTLTAGVDYTAVFNDDGTVSIALMGSHAEDGSLTVSGKRIDPSKVTAADIIGGVDAQGRETGLEVLRQVYPALNRVPGLLLAPQWSEKAEVAAALQAKTKDLNGLWRLFCVVDIDASERDAIAQKRKQAVTSEDCMAVWPSVKVGDTMYSGSAVAAAMIARNDADNGDIPNVSPSNISVNISAVCMKDGTEVLLDQEQGNNLNAAGICTFVNMNGYKLWGNNTAAYPNTTDPKDRFIAARRFLSWDGNTFILTHGQQIDRAANTRLVQAIVDSENQRGNSLVAQDVCARYELAYLEEENPAAQLTDGKLVFHKYVAPYLPAENIEEVVEFDVDAIAAALTQ